MMLSSHCYFVFILSFLFVNASFAKSTDTLSNILENKQITFCQDAAYAPFSYKKADGTWDGLTVMINNEFAKFLKVKSIQVDIEWSGTIPALLTKKCDMLSVGIIDTPEREKVIAFGAPIYTNNIILALRNDPALIAQIKSNGDQVNYKNLKIAVAEGTSSEYWATLAKINYLVYKTIDAPLNAVLNNKADGMLFEERYIKNLPEDVLSKLYIYDKPFQVEKASGGFRKEDLTLKNKFNEFVKVFLQSGKLPVLLNKYLSQADSKK